MPDAQPSTELSWAGVCLAVYYAAAMWATTGQHDRYYWTARKRVAWLRRHMVDQGRLDRALAANARA